MSASHKLPHGIGSGVGIGGNGDGELDIQRGAEAVQPRKESADLPVILGLGDLAEVVDKDVGDIVIAGVQASQETAQGLEATDREL